MGLPRTPPARRGPSPGPPRQPQSACRPLGLRRLSSENCGWKLSGFVLGFLRLLSFRCKVSGRLSEKQKERTKVRCFPQPWKRYKEGASFPPLEQWVLSCRLGLLGVEEPPLQGAARVSGCHAAGPELPVPPDLLGGQRDHLPLGPSRDGPPLSPLSAWKAWSKEATTTTATTITTTTATITTTASPATATSEEEKGPQPRPVSPADVFHDSGGLGCCGAGDVSAVPPAEGAGRTQRGKLPCGHRVPSAGCETALRGGGCQSTLVPRDHGLACKGLFDPLFLS